MSTNDLLEQARQTFYSLCASKERRPILIGTWIVTPDEAHSLACRYAEARLRRLEAADFWERQAKFQKPSDSDEFIETE